MIVTFCSSAIAGLSMNDKNTIDEKCNKHYNRDTNSNISNDIFMTIRQIISMFEQVNTSLF